jgi:hypothetical protein
MSLDYCNRSKTHCHCLAIKTTVNHWSPQRIAVPVHRNAGPIKRRLHSCHSSLLSRPVGLSAPAQPDIHVMLPKMTLQSSIRYIKPIGLAAPTCNSFYLSSVKRWDGETHSSVQLDQLLSSGWRYYFTATSCKDVWFFVMTTFHSCQAFHFTSASCQLVDPHRQALIVSNRACSARVIVLEVEEIVTFLNIASSSLW